MRTSDEFRHVLELAMSDARRAGRTHTGAAISALSYGLERVCTLVGDLSGAIPAPELHDENDSEDDSPPCGRPDCLHNCEQCVAYYDQVTDPATDSSYRSPQDWANLSWSEMDWLQKQRHMTTLREQIARTTASHKLAAELALACPVVDEQLAELAAAHSRLALADAMMTQAGMYTAAEARTASGVPDIRHGAPGSPE